MGNTPTKEARGGDPATSPRAPPPNTYLDPSPAASRSRTGNRVSRADLTFLGIGSSGASGSQADQPFERRETKQEREARRLERERAIRLKERERSLREEHVDGGYLVTLGTYTGTEDFNKQIVRQLQIERRIAPFWRGLNDWSGNWTEPQLVAAGRGLPIPAADEEPPPELLARPVSPDSPRGSSRNLASLTVPLGPRTLSAASDRSASNAGSALPSPTVPNPPRTSSPFKPRAKQALAAALSVGSRNGSQTDIVPREIQLPYDPFVNGQQIEVFLYKEPSECPICFLYYPPYLNKTRCCDQPICSECFVQIKRPDPHLPEHHGDQNNGEQPNPEEAPDQLISEPATCPYCQQPEFGVTYEPPPFRRGLTYSLTSSFGAMSTAMSSQSSLNSANMSPSSPSSGARRRTQSLSANAPNVVTTDRVRPDWATKLAAQRAHQARRAAAATALHTAAYLMNNSESRTFAFTRPGRFSRRNTNMSIPGSSTTVPDEAGSGGGGGGGGVTEAMGEGMATGPEPGPRGSSGRGMLLAANRRSRMEELEDMMFAEAVRLSLAAEEDRKRKADKEARKEAKKKEKEERKALKQQMKSGDVYASGQTSASGSSLSLGLGRRRGNSGASNLRFETTLPGPQVASAASSSGDLTIPSQQTTSSGLHDKGKGVDRSGADEEAGHGSSSVGSLPIPMPGPHRGPSHLRQMSNASSISSSLVDTPAGSFSAGGHLSGHLDGSNPRTSGLSLGSRSEDGDRDPGSAGMEPMFNFRSLAEMVGVQIEGDDAVQGKDGALPSDSDASVDDPKTGGSSPLPDVEESVATLKPKMETQPSSASSQTLNQSTPELLVTPETPGPVPNEDSGSKQLGGGATVTTRASEVTQ